MNKARKEEDTEEARFGNVKECASKSCIALVAEKYRDVNTPGSDAASYDTLAVDSTLQAEFVVQKLQRPNSARKIAVNEWHRAMLKHLPCATHYLLITRLSVKNP